MSASRRAKRAREKVIYYSLLVDQVTNAVVLYKLTGRITAAYYKLSHLDFYRRRLRYYSNEANRENVRSDKGI